MPGRPVSEVIRVLREDHPRVRIVILSGLMDDLMFAGAGHGNVGVDALATADSKHMAPEILSRYGKTPARCWKPSIRRRTLTRSGDSI